MKIAKAIVSFVVSASLGCLSAVHVVQSFQPIQPLASSFAGFGFGRRVNVADTALVSPHAANSHIVYCNGNKVSCGTWMGRRSGAAAPGCNVVLCDSGVAPRLTGIRVITALCASGDNQSPEPLASVWIQLYIDRKEAGHATKVKLRLGADVDDLAKLVKEEFKDKLGGISAAELMVYAYSDEPFTKLLDPGETVTSVYGGVTSQRPIRVTAITGKRGTLTGTFSVLSTTTAIV
jgi:hypothetical protein